MCCTELIGILAQWERFEGREREATHHHSSHPAKQAVGRLTSSHLAAARSPTNVAFNGAHSTALPLV